jgi:hypothetical protein
VVGFCRHGRTASAQTLERVVRSLTGEEAKFGYGHPKDQIFHITTDEGRKVPITFSVRGVTPHPEAPERRLSEQDLQGAHMIINSREIQLDEIRQHHPKLGAELDRLWSEDRVLNTSIRDVRVDEVRRFFFEKLKREGLV